jgi:hypothetical protein
MSILLQIAALAISAVSLVALTDIALSLRKLLETYIPRYKALRTVTRSGGWDGLPSHCGDAVWVFRDGRWSLSDESNCQPGCEPGPPPKFDGEFDGHTVRKPCRRRPKAKA